MAQNNQVKVVDKVDATALGEIVNAELSNQIATAKRYPRAVNDCLTQLATLATRSDAVAESCMYTLKRRDKGGGTNWITGPSVRFAELLLHCWGNMRAGARIIEEADKFVVAQGVAYDLERNTGLSVEVRRGIATSSGGRYGTDMINVTSNAACSIALRNAVFDAIPEVLWREVYEEVKAKAVGAAQIPEKIQNAVKYFVGQGAKVEDILTALGVKAVADMGREHLEIFIGLRTAMKEGNVTADKIFTEEGAEQRQRLRLIDDGDEPMTPIGAVMDRAAAARAASEGAAQNDGGPSKQAAAEVGDGAGAPKGSRSKGKAAKADAGSAAPTEKLADGDSPADPVDEADDIAFVGDIAGKLDPAKAMSSRKLVNEHRGALARIAELASDPALKASAAKILQDWPAK